MILSGNLTLEKYPKLSGNHLPGTIHDFIWKLHLTSSGNIHNIGWKSVVWKHSWYCLEMSILYCLETFRILSMMISCLVLIWKPSQAGSFNQFLECFQTNILANPSSGISLFWAELLKSNLEFKLKLGWNRSGKLLKIQN